MNLYSVREATVTCDDDPTYGEKFYIGLAENLKNDLPTIKLLLIKNVTKKRRNYQMRFGNQRGRTLN